MTLIERNSKDYKMIDNCSNQGSVIFFLLKKKFNSTGLLSQHYDTFSVESGTHIHSPQIRNQWNQRRILPKTDLATCGNMSKALLIRMEMTQKFYMKAHPSMKVGNLEHATQPAGVQ